MYVINFYFILTLAHGSKVGQKDGVIDTSLHVLLEVSEYVPHDEKFDIMFFVSLTPFINILLFLIKAKDKETNILTKTNN